MAENERLLQQYRDTGDKQFLNELAARNERLVNKIAIQYQTKTPDHYKDDLTQEGWKGFMTAVRKFEDGKGALFSTYAAIWIKAKIQRFIEQRIPMIRSVTNDQSRMVQTRYVKVRNRLLAHNPSMSQYDLQIEVAEICNCRPEDVERVQFQRRFVDSLDRPVRLGENDSRCLPFSNRFASDSPIPDESIFKSINRTDFRAVYDSVMDKKTEKKRVAMGMRFAGGCTLQEIGTELGVSREYIRQILNETLTDFRKAFGCENHN